MEARNLGVKIKTNQKVQRVFKEQDIWKVQVEGWIYEGEAVILANGSKASAISGSDGSGYELAAALGHRLIEPLPALTARNAGIQAFPAGQVFEQKAELRCLWMGKKSQRKQENYSLLIMAYLEFRCFRSADTESVH